MRRQGQRPGGGWGARPGGWRARRGIPPALALLGLVVGCAPSAPDLSKLEPSRLEERERALRERSDEYLARLEEAELVFEDETFRAYAQGVTDALLETRGLSPGEVRVVLLDLSSMNAAILANGALLLHVGIASQIESEAQLATLLGHEIAHHSERHALAGDVYEDQAEERAKQSRIAAALLLLPTGLWPLAFADVASTASSRRR